MRCTETSTRNYMLHFKLFCCLGIFLGTEAFCYWREKCRDTCCSFIALFSSKLLLFSLEAGLSRKCQSWICVSGGTTLMCHLPVSQIKWIFPGRDGISAHFSGVFALEKPHSNNSAFFLQEECLPFVLTTPAHCSFLNTFPISAVWVFCLFFTKK